MTTKSSVSPHRSPRPQRRVTAVSAALLVALVTVSCSRPDDGDGDSPGANTRVGDVLIRYAHLEDPADTDVHPEGADVPLYVWLSNESDAPVELVGASSEVAETVVATPTGLPLSIPPGQLLELGREGRHLLLRDITKDIAGQDLVPVTFSFEPGGSTTVMVEPVEVLPGEAEGE